MSEHQIEYWAKKPHQEFVNDLDNKIDDFQQLLTSSHQFTRIIRNFNYFKGNFYKNRGMDGENEIRLLGPDNEYVGIGINNFANIINHYLINIASKFPSLIVNAKNSDSKSLKQAKAGRHLILHYVKEKDLGTALQNALRDSLLTGAGFIKTTWNPFGGNITGGNPDIPKILYEGDLSFDAVPLFNMSWDTSARNWSDSNWVNIESTVNKWDFAALFPEFKDFILDTEPAQDFYKGYLFDDMVDIDDADKIKIREFYHKPTPALPYGRFVLSIPGTVIIDGKNPYGKIPVRRIVPSEGVLSAFGHTFTFDLQPLQEALNKLLSIILTNEAHFGVQSIAIHQGSLTGDGFNLEGGLRAIEYVGQPPQPLNLTNSPAELFKTADLMNRFMELTSGINAAIRGNPDPNVRSDAMFTSMEETAARFTNGVAKSYHKLIEDVGTDAFDILKNNLKEEKIIQIIGKQNQSYTLSFKKEDLQEISRVTVEEANATINSMDNKIKVAQILQSANLLKSPEELATLLSTGSLDPLVEAINAELDTIHDENEHLAEGIPVICMPDHHHVLHLKRHTSTISSERSKNNPQVLKMTLGHKMEHIRFLLDPNWQAMQVAMGFEVPPITALPPMNEEAINQYIGSIGTDMAQPAPLPVAPPAPAPEPVPGEPALGPEAPIDLPQGELPAPIGA